MTSAALDPAVSASVAASAGTGKTWLLTARIVRLLLAGAKPGGILALTFTRKAAAEMRVRVNDRLRELAEADDRRCDALLAEIGETPTPGLRERARQLYRQQLFDPYPLRATTLHAFCQDLIGRFAFEAEVTPGFKLIEQEGPLYAQAWRQLQRRILRRPQSAAALAFASLIELGFGEHRLRALVIGFLQRRSDWRAWVQNQTDAVAYATAQLQTQLGKDPTPDLEDPKAFNARLTVLLRHLQTLEGGTKYLRADKLAPALEQSGAAQLQTLSTALLTQEGAAYKITGKEKILEKLKGGERQHFLDTYERVQHEFAKYRRAAARERSLLCNQAAYALGAAALAVFDHELARDGALTFAEIEWAAYRLLQRDGGAEWVRYKLDQKIDHLLLDEFQDTNPTQWRLLLPLLEEMAAGDSGRTRSTFIVGDAKQSIYSFRRAQPELFDAAQAWLSEELQAVSETQTETRRSAPAVVGFVNALFADARGETLGFKTHSTTRAGDWGRVEVAPLIGRDDDVEPEPGLRDPLKQKRQSREETRAEREADQVATRIQALVASGVAVRDKTGTHRLGYGDVMVLARQRKHLSHLEQALSRAKIPFAGAARGTLLETSEARDLRALLRWLDAPHRDLELAQVLRSPLFSCGDGVLMQLARAAAADWFAALKGLTAADPRLATAVTLLTRWREHAKKLPVHDLLDRIVIESDAARRYESALPPAAARRVRANLGAFQQLALTADSGRYPSLSGFLDHLDEQVAAEKDAPDEAPASAESGQVRILTIHGAKGLEAPAVFIVNAGSPGKSHRAAPWLVEWPAAEAGPRCLLALGHKDERDTLSEALLEQQKLRDERENLNLLYVATTRARQFLHISGFFSGSSKEPSDKTWHAWALQAMAALGAKDDKGTLTHAAGAPAQAPPPAVAPVIAVDERLRKPLPALKRTTAPSGESRAAFNPEAAARGDAIHFLLQKLAAEKTTDDAGLRAALEQALGRSVNERDYREWRHEAEAVLKAPALTVFFNPGVRAWNEVPLLDAAGEGGVADRVVDDGHTLWVLDYKTTPSPDAAELRERYRSQIEDYGRAARTVWPDRSVRGGLILTARCEFVEIGSLR